MLSKTTLPGIPPTKVNAVFGSFSLTACVISILELDSPPCLWENFGFDWFNQLDTWCHTQRLQALQLTADAQLRGFHIRFFRNPKNLVRLLDGTEAPRLEATAWVNNQMMFNPAEADLSQMSMHNSKLVFLPYDPTPTTIRFAN